MDEKDINNWLKDLAGSDGWFHSSNRKTVKEALKDLVLVHSVPMDKAKLIIEEVVSAIKSEYGD